MSVSLVVTDQLLENTRLRFPAGGVPCLNHVVAASNGKPCSTCPGKVKKPDKINGDNARICITQLSKEDLTKLKRALGADTLILYIDHPGFPRRTDL